MVPVTLRVRSFGDNNTVRKERDLHFSVFVQQKWTPYLMMLTLANTLQQINEYADEVTYRMSGHVDVEGAGSIQLSTMLAGGEMPSPPPLMLATWWGEKFNRLFLNPVKMPKLKAVECVIDLLP